MNWYAYRIYYFDEVTTTNDFDYGAIHAQFLSDAVEETTKMYGEDNIESVEFRWIDDSPCLSANDMKTITHWAQTGEWKVIQNENDSE